MANRIILRCARCGQDFSVNKAREKTARYCSKVCSQIGLSAKSCIVCGTSFTPHYANKDTARYCSHKCKGADCHAMGGYRGSLHARFLSAVDKTPGHGPDGDCWIWTRTNLSKDGYGRLRLKKKWVLAHRHSYATFVEPIPDGAFVCHSCDNRLCVNPGHLWLGDARSNTHDMIAKGRDRYLVGQESAPAKLTDEQALSILNDSRPQNIIAEEYGISKAAVCLLKNRKTWKHLTIDDSSSPTSG